MALMAQRDFRGARAPALGAALDSTEGKCAVKDRP
jgi:hypothetical protein